MTDATTPRTIRLEVIRGAAAGTSFRLAPPFDVEVGRGRGCGVRLPDHGVSRLHCRLVASSRELRVSDPGSKHGTRLNGKQVELARVHHGDVLDLGPARLRVVVVAGSDATARLAEFVFCERCGRTLADASLASEGVGRFGERWLCAACLARTRSDAPAICGYRVFATLGEGQFATVYKAIHEDRDDLVALKVVQLRERPSATCRERLAREIAVLSQLRHPGIVRLDEAGFDGDRVWLALELVDGADLKSRVDQGGRLEPALAARIARQLAIALAHAHERNIVHRDLKPANVLLASDDGSVKLADFGMAKSLDESGVSELTRTGALIGTPYYMAPEQTRDSKHVTPLCDVYALGATLFHLLCGEPAFARAATTEELFLRKLEGPSPGEVREIAPDVPAGLAALVERSLAADPEARPPSARAYADELAAFAVEVAR